MPANLSPPHEYISPTALSEEDDAALAHQARHDPEAFAELYHRHVGRIYRYHLARSGDAEDAQDLTSQTFLAALERIDTYRGEAVFLGWLFGIASHKAGDHYRRRRLNLPLESADELMATDPLPEDVASQRSQMALVSQALGDISPERAEALVLRVFAGMSAAEAGQVMGKNEAAIRMLVHRGLRDLHQRLSPKEVEL